MSDVRPVLTPGESVGLELSLEETEEDIDPGEVHQVQKIAGS